MLSRALIRAGTALLATGLLSSCAAAQEDQWDLPLSPMDRPRELPLNEGDLCAALSADRISLGCRVMAESGTAEIIVIPRLGMDMSPYSHEVNGDSVRWVGISRFPAIQLAVGSGSDGIASCRIALDVAQNQVLLIVYRRQAADPELAPCRPARDYAAKALAALQATTAKS